MIGKLFDHNKVQTTARYARPTNSPAKALQAGSLSGSNFQFAYSLYTICLSQLDICSPVLNEAIYNIA